MKQKTRKSFLKKLTCPKGGFSPFMFGMLASVAVFSAMMQKVAMDEVKRQEEYRLEEQQSQADKIALAVENAILTENVHGDNTYSAEVTLQRAQRFMSGTTGFNAAGEEVQFNSLQTDKQYKSNNQRIIINTTDDAYVKEDIAAIQGDRGAADFKEVDGTRVIDTNALRQKQITQSREYLEMEAAQVYRSYVSFGFKFPTESEYKETINAATNLHDVWGQQFTYTRKGDKKAELSFTTPWGYTVTKQLSME